MATVVKMPRLSDTMTEGVLVRWLKRVGDSVSAGEVLAEVETDKATMELEAFDEGMVAQLLVAEGARVAIGAGLLILVAEGEPLESADAAGPSAGSSPYSGQAGDGPSGSGPEAGAVAGQARVSGPEPGAQGLVAPMGPEAGGAGGRLKASPLARKLAREHDLVLSNLKGSGPGGRIVKRDVEGALAQGGGVAADAGAGTPVASRLPEPAPVVAEAASRAPARTPEPKLEPMPVAAAATSDGAASFLPGAVQPGAVQPGAGQASSPLDGASSDSLVPLSSMRRAIAERLTAAKQTIPHFYVTSEVEMDAAMALREQLNAAAAGEVKVSVNDLVLKAVAAALRQHPRVNASFTPEGIIEHRQVDVALAVALEDGLVTPVIRGCDQKSVGQLAREARQLAERAQAKRLKLEELRGGTFTVSNLGMFGVVSFSAIINPPQAAILAVGSVREVPVVKEGRLEVGKRMQLTLSCDHRVIDGAVAARFLQTVGVLLASPLKLLL